MNYVLNFEYLLARLAGQLEEREIALIRRAYEVAEAAHSGQTRDEGTP